jgi:hypothetical protein
MPSAEIDVETIAARERSGFSRPLTQRNAPRYLSRTLPGYSVLGGVGLVPVLITAALAASPLLLVLEGDSQ